MTLSVTPVAVAVNSWSLKVN